MNSISINSSDVRKSWSSIIDAVVREKPVFIQRTHDNITMISTKMLQSFLEPLTFTISFVTEDDGSFTASLEELDIFVNASSKDECMKLLLDDMKEYAQDFYSEFNFWSSAPNRKKHIPYVLKILSTPDDKLLNDMKCQMQLPDENDNSNVIISAIKRISNTAIKNGISEMSLDEINAEIDAVRQK
ncbi:MAG: hypothetical protein IJU48_07045 [Synergistaceae bacterium]|nr:hypothetical protein [Synergistaceae bacterium]